MSSGEFKENIKKLRSLREKLCEKQTGWQRESKLRNFVVGELQDMHEKLKTSDDSPEWCSQKVENILQEILSLPEDNPGGCVDE